MRAGAIPIGTEMRQATPRRRATCATARPWLPSVAVVSVVSAGSVAATVRRSAKVRGIGAPARAASAQLTAQLAPTTLNEGSPSRFPARA